MPKTNINKQNKQAEKIIKRTMRKFKKEKLHTGSTNRLVVNKKEALRLALTKVREKGEVAPSMEDTKTKPSKSMKPKSNKHKRTHDDKW